MSKWEQLELPFEKAPEALVQKVRDATVDKPQFRCGFTVYVQHDGEFVVKTLFPSDAPVERLAETGEIERAARAVSDHERDRLLVDRIAQRLQPRDLTQEALRTKARERGVI